MPVLAKIGVENGKLTNSELLREQPDKLVASLADLISGQVGQFVGAGFKPLDPNQLLASLGLATPEGMVLTVLAVGAGAMVVSHV